MAGFFGFGNNSFEEPFGVRSKFEDNFKCYSMVFFSSTKEEADFGGKVILPPSALERLSRLNISYPMLFNLTNPRTGRQTHSGVLEFSAEEGRVYVPRWMLNHLYCQDGDLITVQNVSLKLATFSKFQPQTVDFLDITNPKAVLELKLRLFACLSKGDIIQLKYNEKIYELLVLETQPQNAVSIIECDMKVDFAPPVGYVQPEPVPMETTDTHDQMVENGSDIELPHNDFKVFSGQGQRLDGKTKNLTVPQGQQQVKRERGVPNYGYIRGKITFAKAKSLKIAEEPMDDEDQGFSPFSGSGQKLKPKKKK